MHELNLLNSNILKAADIYLRHTPSLTLHTPHPHIVHTTPLTLCTPHPSHCTHHIPHIAHTHPSHSTYHTPHIAAPLHWIYDQGKVQGLTKGHTTEFYPTSQCPFYTIETGRTSAYGDQLHVTLKFLAARKGAYVLYQLLIVFGYAKSA